MGQHVWWNEGVCIGYIEHVIGTPEQMRSWGLTEPGIAVSNLHPFEAISAKHPQHLGGISHGDTVVYALSDLADEGVGLLSATEEAEFTWAAAHARSLLQPEHRQSAFCVTAVMDTASWIEYWHFDFLDSPESGHQHISFLFRPNTRTTDDNPI